MNPIKLPENIDYSKYNSDSGMATKFFGPRYWDALFVSILGRYPMKIDMSNTEHIIIRNAYKSMLIGLSVVMPCVFCRDSLKIFLSELPIEDYLIGRIELMYWLYLIKDKVNKKLLRQEHTCYNDEKKRLKSLFYAKQISEEEYYKNALEFKHDTFQTVPTIPFKEVLDKYEALRAVCSTKAKTCALPKKK